MFDGYEHFEVDAGQAGQDLTIRGIRSNPSSPLPPLLLIHGFPQTYHIWHRVAPRLAEHFTLVLMDLRGYGTSSKPSEVEAYAKSAMARDCIAVMDHLGFTGEFQVCAHDRGARVAHKLCVDFPQRVRAVMLLDICPTLAMYTQTDMAFAKAYFHWFLLIQEAPLPETLILMDPRKFADLFMRGRQQAHIFDDACYEEYVKALGDPDTVHAMCQDYRASASLDLDEARADQEAGRKIECRLRVLWGKHGVIEACFKPLKEWEAVSTNPANVSGRNVESGHYIPEHAPDDLVAEILSFFDA